MSARRLGQSSVLLAIAVVGVWLLGRPGALTPESTARQRALVQALAPAGSGVIQGSGDVVVGESVVHDPVEPVTVDFRNIEIHTDETDSMYYQWLQGEIDLDKESIISEAEIATRQQLSRQLAPQPEVQQATSGPSVAAPARGASFDAIPYSADNGGSVPPDPELAVGPQHMIAVVNVAAAIYDKSGNALLGPLHAANLFSQSICQSGLYDPNVLYDEKENRWFIAYDKGPGSSSGGYCVLASRSDDPLGQWNEYFFPLNNGSTWLDFPHAGVGDNYIVVGGNMFSYAFSFIEGRVFAFRKSDLYAGNSVSAVQRGLSSSHSTPQPLNLHGQSSGAWPSYGNNHYILTDPFNGQTYHLVRWNIDSNVLDIVGTVDLGSYGFPISVPQQGGDDLQANDHRPLDFEYRNGYGWTTMTVACNPGAGTVNCIRYAQIDLSDASLGPAGTAVYASNDAHRTFPDLAVNRCGDMAIGYTKSSANMHPGIWVTGRQADDPYGALQGEIELKAGEVSYHSFESSRPYRWGDYTGMTIDPDGATFWYFGQYSKNTGSSARWGTYIGSFAYGSCGGFPSLYDEHMYLPLITIQTSAPTPTEPLENGDFERGPAAWNEYSQRGFELIIQDDGAPVFARSGQWLAWLGGSNNEISVLSQSATVPEEDSTLRFWHWIGSEDVCGYDYGGVVVNYGNNSTSVDVFDLCEQTSTNGWQLRTVDLHAYAGLTVEIELRAETDDSLNSNLFIDDVSLGAVSTLSGTQERAYTAIETAARSKEHGDLIAAPAAATAPRLDAERLWPVTGDSK